MTWNILTRNPNCRKLNSLSPNAFRKWQAGKTENNGTEVFQKAVIDLYDAEIRAFDKWFGFFANYLKEKNLYDNSMIVFLSDHGEAFYEHGTWNHPHTVYNEVARVPLIVKFPKNAFKGKLIRHEVGLIDVMPTILNYYKIPFDSKQVDGRDLMELIKGKTWNRPVLTTVSTGIYALKHGFQVALFKDSDKFIYRVPVPKMGKDAVPEAIKSKTEEFFNLQSDPGETINLNQKQPHKLKKFQSFFNRIIKIAVESLRRKDKKVVIDKNFRKQLKSLGYLLP